MATLEDKLYNVSTRIQQNTGIQNLVPGTTAYSIVEASCYEQMKLEASQEGIELRNSIINATGSDLDFIGDTFFGIKRRASIAPVITETSQLIKIYTSSTFGGINSGNSIVIPAGQFVMDGIAPNGYWKFVNQDAITLNSGEKIKYIAASLILGPYDVIPANTIINHTFESYADAANKTLRVTNTSAIATGRPEESDSNYRYRISKALQSFVQTSYFGIHAITTDLPGISDVQISNASNGGGTFTLYVNSIMPGTSDQLLSDVENLTIQCIPPWVSYSVVGPNYIGLSLSVSVSMSNIGNITDASAMQQQIINTISSYINNVTPRSFYLREVESVVANINPNITSVLVTAATLHTGQGDFRSAKAFDMSNDLSLYIYINANEKLIVEPLLGAVTVGLQ